MSWNPRNAVVVVIGIGLALSLTGLGLTEDASRKTQTQPDLSSKAPPPCREMADALASQWKRGEDRKNWVEEEQERHTILPPADNSDLLEGDQGEGHAYGRYTEKDLLLWQRELTKFVAEGSRIFHNADLLGSSIAVSCDMCHPDAANTHPETYPKFQSQLGRVVLLRDMINWCVQQAVRGEPLPVDGPKMRALEAYIQAQRKGVAMNYGRH